MTTAELVKKHGSATAAAKAIGVNRSTINRRLLREGARRTEPSAAKPTAQKAPPQSGKSLSEFRKLYDKDFIVPSRVKTALSGLGDAWVYEVEFCRLAGVTMADLGNYRDRFADHVVVLKESRRAWAGTKALAKKMREMV